MRLTEAKRKYRNQWIAFQYTDRENKLGRVLFHDRDRNQFDIKMLKRKKKLNGAYLTYTGPLVPKDVVVVLSCLK
jgi:hypothetical protein